MGEVSSPVDSQKCLLWLHKCPQMSIIIKKVKGIVHPNDKMLLSIDYFQSEERIMDLDELSV